MLYACTVCTNCSSTLQISSLRDVTSLVSNHSNVSHITLCFLKEYWLVLSHNRRTLGTVHRHRRMASSSTFHCRKGSPVGFPLLGRLAVHLRGSLSIKVKNMKGAFSLHQFGSETSVSNLPCSISSALDYFLWAFFYSGMGSK